MSTCNWWCDLDIEQLMPKILPGQLRGLSERWFLIIYIVHEGGRSSIGSGETNKYGFISSLTM